jgi:hypothetical protein
MTNEQLAQAKSPIFHLFTALGADVPTYNLPGVLKHNRSGHSIRRRVFSPAQRRS